MTSWTSQTQVARDRDLETRIDEDTDALEPYLIYADWLQERGDPRGELIAIQVLMETGADALDALHRREVALLREVGSSRRYCDGASG